MTIDEKLKNIFRPNQKCIINADLDGLLSGMLLQKALNWEIIGFSSCAGKKDDELWLNNPSKDFTNKIFVDLPVVDSKTVVIDQHFVALHQNAALLYNENINKINPNILQMKSFINNNNFGNQYTEKYPFGTVHFIFACLERMNLLKKISINFFKILNNEFETLDLFLRADCVIGNTNKYTKNCFNWIEWLQDFGGIETKKIFNIVKEEYDKRIIQEKYVEIYLKQLGCDRTDGDCSNMLRNKDYNLLNKYFIFLSEAFDLPSLPIFKLYDYGNLTGKRIFINHNIQEIKQELNNERIFSYAFVSKKFLSITNFKEKEKNNE